MLGGGVLFCLRASAALLESAIAGGGVLARRRGGGALDGGRAEAGARSGFDSPGLDDAG